MALEYDSSFQEEQVSDNYEYGNYETEDFERESDDLKKTISNHGRYS